MMATVTFGQDLPENPEPGKCYVRCKTPDVYKNETVNVAKKSLRFLQNIEQFKKKF